MSEAKDVNPSSKEAAQRVVSPKWLSKKKNIISRESIDSRTRHLIHGLESGLSISATLRRIEDLCEHLRKYPETRGVAIKVSFDGIQPVFLLKSLGTISNHFENRRAVKL